MATKRNLYKPVLAPVVKPNYVIKRNRKPLAQGRLVSSASELSNHPRLQQGELNTTQASDLSSTLRDDDPSSTPRRTVPVPPLPTHDSLFPSRVLDLSDESDAEAYTEKDVPEHSRLRAKTVPHHHHPQVMVLDASALGSTSNRAEVDCVYGYELSQAKVICHSPRGGDIAWQVREDTVPRAAAISPLSTETGTQQEPRADSDINSFLNKSIRTPSKNRSFKMDDSGPRLPQPNFDESGESEKAEAVSAAARARQQLPAPGPSDVTSDSETVCSLFEYVPQIKDRTVPVATEMLAEKQPKAAKLKREQKKMKSERTVPSRYMQTAAKRSGSNTSLTSHKKSTSLESTFSSNKKILDCPPAGRHFKSVPRDGSDRITERTSSRSIKAATSSPERESNSRSSRVTSSQSLRVASSLERDVNDRSLQGKTSTPTHENAPIMASCDASAINPELSMMSMFDASHFKAGSGSGHLDGNNSPRVQGKKLDLKAQQQRIDMAYARYLQWAFLDAKAAKMLQQQEKEAMRQQHALWGLMEEKRQETARLEEEVAQLKHLNMLDQQLETQLTSLEPTVKMLPVFKKDYGHMAAALDTTRHQLLTRGVLIPEDEEFYLASLQEALAESEQLLATLCILTKKEAPAVGQFADAVKAIEKSVEAECNELYRCGELLSAVQSLTTHENSLQIQAMQSRK